MVDIDELVETLRGGFTEPQAVVLARTMAHVVGDIEREMVRREDFRELTGIVRALAEAQLRTEERLETLTARVDTLTERLETLTARVDTLAEAQQRTEERLETLTARVDALTTRVDTLAAQMEALTTRVDTLAARVNDLAVQLGVLVKTQQQVEKRLQKTDQRVAGLSDTIGYRLEDEAMETLPYALRQDFHIVVEGYLERKHVRHLDGRTDEINILGQGRRDGQWISIVGEAKAQLGKRHLDDLLKKVKRLQAGGFLKKECMVVAVTYSVDLKVEAYAKELGVRVYRSFELRRVRPVGIG